MILMSPCGCFFSNGQFVAVCVDHTENEDDDEDGERSA